MFDLRQTAEAGAGERAFPPGTLVRHRSDGYRAVVVDSDPSCRAPDDWYWARSTQPARAQPWYHLLIDGGSRSGYVAEESLERDPAPEPVRHPQVDQFFGGFNGESYLRNDEPWPDPWGS
jgi:heat shock protein HspQ